MTTPRPLASRLLRVTAYILAAVTALLAVLLAYLWFGPLGLGLRPTSTPLRDYPEAAQAVQQLAAAEGDAVNPLCHTRLLGHGARTARAIVIFHGISNCPQQFATLAALLHARGYNVLLARLPRQGMADRLSDAPAEATAEEAVAACSVTSSAGVAPPPGSTPLPGGTPTSRKCRTLSSLNQILFSNFYN